MLQYQQRKQYSFRPKIQNKRMLDDLPHARCPTVLTPAKMEDRP